MKISLITPTYNQGQYLEETIRSVLDQGVPDLEYIVLDGGSTDGTPEILERYSDRLAYWCSERDRGQVDALNKGFARATGDIVGFINSDDVLLPGALRTVLDAFTRQPDLDLVYGGVEWMNGDGQGAGFHAGEISDLADVLDVYDVWWRERQWVQPEVFYRRTLKERVGAFDERYNLAFDYDFWVRCFLAGARVARLPERLVRFRLHSGQKSAAAQKAADEIRTIVQRHLEKDPPIPAARRRLIEAQLGYDIYQLGQNVWAGRPRPSFFSALLSHPQWLLAPAARKRATAAVARVLLGRKKAATP